jgi:hypothetical protein
MASWANFREKAHAAEETFLFLYIFCRTIQQAAVLQQQIHLIVSWVVYFQAAAEDFCTSFN